MAEQPKYTFGPFNGQIGPIVGDIKVEVGIIAAVPERKGDASLFPTIRRSTPHALTHPLPASRYSPTLRAREKVLFSIVPAQLG
jgi:hypothetical protein